MITMPVTNMLTVSEAAEKFGVSRQRMHVLIRNYKIKVEKVGPIQLIEQKDLLKIPSHRPTGVKKNSKSRA